MNNPIERLYASVIEAAAEVPPASRTARLMRDGMPKMAKKVAEEAIEVSLDAVVGNREAVILESADLIYNLAVLWAGAGVAPGEIWAEMERRERLYGIAEKLAKDRPSEA
jgi:phosphoribosyl-ATP pyrophosphohydrolase